MGHCAALRPSRLSAPCRDSPGEPSASSRPGGMSTKRAGGGSPEHRSSRPRAWKPSGRSDRGAGAQRRSGGAPRDCRSKVMDPREWTPVTAAAPQGPRGCPAGPAVRRTDMAVHAAANAERARGEALLGRVDADRDRAVADRSDKARAVPSSAPCGRPGTEAGGALSRRAAAWGHFPYALVCETALPPCEGSGIASYRLCPSAPQPAARRPS